MENFIGTSGFSYPSWKGGFYPAGLKPALWLAHYAARFNSLELNHTFYRFPRVEMLRKQAAAVPEGFRFSVKMHKSITHTLRLRDAQTPIAEFIQTAEEGLGNALGCLLFQLPASFTYSSENLERVLENVPPGARHVVEFRHISWWEAKVWDTLARHDRTFCNVSFPGLPDVLRPAGDLFYLRMHGVPELFESSYSKATLRKLTRQLPVTGERYVYFNNTMHEAGYSNALDLLRLLE